MKKNYSLLFILILGITSCSMQKLVSIAATTEIPVTMTTTSSNLNLSITLTPTLDSLWCSDREKECEIARSLGVGILQIDSFSPNMKWVAMNDLKMAKFPPDKDIGGMKFVKVDKSKEWKFNATQMREDIGECSNIFMTNFWSNDSRYVYFSPHPSYCSRMFNFSDIGTQVLYRLDVETGATEEFLPFIKYHFSSGYERWGLYTFEFSPNGRYLVYFQSYGSPMIIHVKDLKTEDEITYELDNKYLEAGCPAWMDDSIHVLFYAATTTRPGESTTASLYIIDLEKRTIQAIYHEQPNVYCTISNPYYREKNPDVKNLIPVNKMTIEYQLMEQFYLNPLTRQKVLWPTATPYPSSTSRP